MDFMFSIIYQYIHCFHQQVLLDTYVWLSVVGKKPYVGTLTIVVLCINLCLTTVYHVSDSALFTQNQA